MSECTVVATLFMHSQDASQSRSKGRQSLLTGSSGYFANVMDRAGASLIPYDQSLVRHCALVAGIVDARHHRFDQPLRFIPTF